ncbi:MAG: hypothetical protein R2787_04360 [Saprospiraceae bacterium]
MERSLRPPVLNGIGYRLLDGDLLPPTCSLDQSGGISEDDRFVGRTEESRILPDLQGPTQYLFDHRDEIADAIIILATDIVTFAPLPLICQQEQCMDEVANIGNASPRIQVANAEGRLRAPFDGDGATTEIAEDISDLPGTRGVEDPGPNGPDAIIGMVLIGQQVLRDLCSRHKDAEEAILLTPRTGVFSGVRLAPYSALLHATTTTGS